MTYLEFICLPKDFLYSFNCLPKDFAHHKNKTAFLPFSNWQLLTEG